ncbi:MAG: CHASE2 domain-containing protein [Bacteroidaceae bacterium]|nr:CHASE2 domain-containing protein [Bacteroidaceae bacterium]
MKFLAKIRIIIKKSFVLKSLVISLFAFLLSYGLYHGLNKYLYYFGIDTSNLSYLQQYYENINSTTTIDNRSNDIIILSVNDSTNRDSIAVALDTIFNYKPKVVGIDFFFSSNILDNDSLLKDRIQKHADSIVLAQVYGGDGDIERGIFDKDSLLTFGLIHSYNDIRFPYKDNGYYNFAYEIAKKYNPTLFDNEKLLDNFVINYSNINFHHIDILGYKNASKEEKEYKDEIIDNNVRNKIVLIGPYDDVFDIHPTQFVIEKKRMLSGIKFHAYAINSLIHPEIAMKELSIESCGNMLIFWGFCFIYSLFFVLFTDENIKHRKWFAPLTTWPSSIILVIIAAIILACGFYLMKYFKIIPDVTPLFISIFVINTLSDLLSRFFILKK